MSRKREALEALGKTIKKWKINGKRKKYDELLDFEKGAYIDDMRHVYAYRKAGHWYNNLINCNHYQISLVEEVFSSYVKQMIVVFESIFDIVGYWPDDDAGFLEMCRKPFHIKFGILGCWDGIGPTPDISHLRGGER